jgi:hypothetical protein
MTVVRLAPILRDHIVMRLKEGDELLVRWDRFALDHRPLGLIHHLGDERQTALSSSRTVRCSPVTRGRPALGFFGQLASRSY